jgi:hypothetical protein
MFALSHFDHIPLMFGRLSGTAQKSPLKGGPADDYEQSYRIN